MFRISLLFIALCLLHTAAAQFGPFFNNMFDFGGHQQQHQQQQQQSSGSQWLAFADSISCSTYLCPDTNTCVAKPSECPCPNVQDVRCIIPDAQEPDGTVLCLRGGSDCLKVDAFAARKFS